MPGTVTAEPTLLDGETVPASDLRRELLGGLYPAAGIVSGLAVAAQPTPDMSVLLPAGKCLVDDGSGGFVPLSLLADTTLAIDPSDATYPRYDSVIGEAVDTGDAATLIRRFRVITGTPAGSPTPPALPPADQPTAKTLRIGNVYVQANAETNGFVRAQDVSVVAAVASPVPGPAKALQVGTASVSFTSQTSFSQSVTFPTPFSSTPVVTTNIHTGSGVAGHWSSRAINITPTGFTMFVFSEAGAAAQTWSAVPVQWMATTP